MQKGFYFSWLFSAILMYAAFYCWHGIVLNDFYRVSFSKSLLMVFAAFSYLAISLLVYYVYHRNFLVNYFPGAFLRAMITGLLVGGFLYMVTTVLGISFNNQMNTLTLLIDLLWQVFEQTLGSVLIALSEKFLFHFDSENK